MHRYVLEPGYLLDLDHFCHTTSVAVRLRIDGDGDEFSGHINVGQ